MSWGRTRGVVAVDIGSNAVKLVEVRGNRVVAAGIREVGLRLREGMSPRDATVATIRDLLAETGISARKAVGIVQGPSTALLRLVVPRMPANELRQAIRWEAQKVLAFPPDNAILAHHILGDVVDRDGIPKLAVFVAAVESQYAEEVVGILRAAGVEPVGLTVVPAALAHLTRIGAIATEPDRVWALVDIGAEVTHLLFFRGAELLLAREIGTGGQSITQAMAAAVMVEGRRVQLDADQAEALKKAYGIPLPSEASHQAEGIPLGQVGAMIQPALDRLVVEIQRSFTYHQERTGSPPPTRLILSGGTAQLPNLGPHLAERLEIDVEVHDPLARLDLPEQVHKGIAAVTPQMAIAAGLALEQARTLNLLPPHIAAARRATWARLGIRAAAVAAALVTVGAYGMAREARTEAEQALAARRSSLADLQPVLEVAKRLQGRRDALAPVLRAYDTLLAGGTPWHGILKELSNLTPRAVTLNELMTMPKGRIKIKGIAFANGASAEMVLADYLGRLESSPFFSAVDLIVSREREDFDVRALDFEATSGIP